MPGGGREAREAERKKHRKNLADAEKAFQKLQEASTVEALTEAVRSGVQLKSYLPALEKALPEAQVRLKKMQETAEKSGLDDFMTRVEEAEKRDAASRESREGNPMATLENYFAELFQDADEDRNGTMDFDEFRQAIDIIAPSFKEKDLKAAWKAADADRSGTIDRQEFMKRAPQYMLLGDRMRRSSVNLDASPIDDEAGDDEKDLSNLSPDEKKRAKRLFKKYDDDGNGGLDFEEFKQVRSAISAGGLFWGCSAVGDGSRPSFAELPAACRAAQVMVEIAGNGLSNKNLIQAFEAVDTNGNGKIDYNEFMAGQQELKKWRQKRKPKKPRSK